MHAACRTDTAAHLCACLQSITPAAVRSSYAAPKAGGPATKPVPYNIITGGSKLENNAFEAFDGGHDYRRIR